MSVPGELIEYLERTNGGYIMKYRSSAEFPHLFPRMPWHYASYKQQLLEESHFSAQENLDFYEQYGVADVRAEWDDTTRSLMGEVRRTVFFFFHIF